jgi:hypothetical protein
VRFDRLYEIDATLYVQYISDIDLESLLGLAREDRKILDGEFVQVGDPAGRVLGIYRDRSNACRVDLVARPAGDKSEIVAGISCPP